MTIDIKAVEALDRDDPLAGLKSRFDLPEGVTYLDGNSLGAALHASYAEIEKAAKLEWGRDLIRSWNTAGWFALPLTLGDRVGRLIGAAAGQTAVTDHTSANVYKALHAALGLNADRKTIVAESASFPTDLYMAEGVMATRPGTVMRLEGVDGPRIEDLIDETVAVVLVNHVNYKTGALRDMAALTKRAHDVGALVVWDLCHSAGALPVELDRCNVDFAVGCTYKYINGGPGAPAFIYVAKRHQETVSQPLSGWWGHARPFGFERSYDGGAGILRFLSGTQPILSLRALSAALDLWDEVDLAAIRTKSIALTNLFISLVEARCGAHGLTLVGPRDGTTRGSQVSFEHEGAYEIMQALIERGVIGDFRAPSTIRFGFTPLYTSFVDVWNAVDLLHDVMETGAWRDARYAVRSTVT